MESEFTLRRRRLMCVCLDPSAKQCRRASYNRKTGVDNYYYEVVLFAIRQLQVIPHILLNFTMLMLLTQLEYES